MCSILFNGGRAVAAGISNYYLAIAKCITVIMKKQLLKLTALTFITLLCALTTNAQALKKSQWRFGIGVEGMAPLGKFERVTKYGLGITPRLQYGLSDNLAFTITSGYYNFFGKVYTQVIPAGTSYTIITTSGDDLGVVPLKAGLKAFLANKIYLGAEAGAALETNGTGNVKLDLSPGLGFASNDWDVSARYERISGSGVHSFLALRVAYSFGL